MSSSDKSSDERNNQQLIEAAKQGDLDDLFSDDLFSLGPKKAAERGKSASSSSSDVLRTCIACGEENKFQGGAKGSTFGNTAGLGAADHKDQLPIHHQHRR